MKAPRRVLLRKFIFFCHASFPFAGKWDNDGFGRSTVLVMNNGFDSISSCLGRHRLWNHQEGEFLTTSTIVIIRVGVERAGQHRVGHFGCVHVNVIKRHRGGGIVNRSPSGIAAIGLIGQAITTFILHIGQLNLCNGDG